MTAAPQRSRSLRRLLLALGATVALAGLTSSGCAAKRYVTATHWHNPDTLFVAYREVEGTSDEGRVKVCRRQPDNRLECKQLAPVNRLLQPTTDKAADEE